MAEEWITPKTNWTSTDFINIADVNRIVNNLLFLKRFSYSIFNIAYKTMPNPTSVTQYPFADELNSIEDNLETLNIKKYVLPIGTKQTFSDNGLGWNYVELNRIESAQLRLYERIEIDRQSINTMKFTLGKQRGFRP